VHQQLQLQPVKFSIRNQQALAFLQLPPQQQAVVNYFYKSNKVRISYLRYVGYELRTFLASITTQKLEMVQTTYPTEPFLLF
jgi:hypothetical protein